MEVLKTYIGTKDGVKCSWCDFKPEEAEIEEVHEMLYPSLDENWLHLKDTGNYYKSYELNETTTINDFEEVTDEEKKDADDN